MIELILLAISFFFASVFAAVIGIIITWIFSKPFRFRRLYGSFLFLFILGAIYFLLINIVGTVTCTEIKEWSIGETDVDIVYSVIYDEVHKKQGKRRFRTGDTIPPNVVLTSDLGHDWQEYPVNALIRNGGWGVFQTTDKFSAPATGEYWNIVPFCF